MTDEEAPTSGTWPLIVIVLLCVGSGCAALIYEVVWFQLLQLSVGSSAVSLGVLLGTFMGGMCLGSLLFSSLISRHQPPLRVYAVIEALIGLCGLLVPVVVPLVGEAYAAWAGTGTRSLILRACVVSLCLIPPTLLMGATLPALARWVEIARRDASWLGFLYGGNLVGAVAGSLAGGFYLLRLYDMPTATAVASGINFLVAVAALVLMGRVGGLAEAPVQAATTVGPTRDGRWRPLLAIALSGLTALGCEVLWTRQLSLLFGATTYTFSLILAVFLVGLGLGSSAGAAITRRTTRPDIWLGSCQVALCAAIAWAANATSASLPFWPINPALSRSVYFNFQLDLLRAAWVILPGALLWGASFPLALSARVSNGVDLGRLVGTTYAANTVGAILGAVTTGLVLVGWTGTQATTRLMIGISALSGFLMLVNWSRADESSPRAIATMVARSLLIGTLAGLLVRSIPPVPGILVAYGRYAATWLGRNEIIYVGEGVTASVAVSRTPSGTLNYHNAGKVQASSEPADMRLQRMLGHLTTLVAERPTKVLVIGCGAGVTAGAVSIDPLVEQETIAEIEPLVPRVVSQYFSDHNFGVISNPKVRVHLDDARHFVLTTNEKFDAITSDPLDPWVRGAATLYTREFFETVKARLNPGGVVTLFVQLYESSEAAVKSEVATFLEAFPDGVVFANTLNGQGYDLVLLGQLNPQPIDVDAVEARLRRPENGAIVRSLQEVGIFSATDLFATFGGQRQQMQTWLADAVINTDRNLRLQYLAGLGLNQYQADAIYRAITREVGYPDGLFAGAPATLEALRTRIEGNLGRTTPD
ncbi:MAG: fused MFS/spermidine synthase [Vicinamibacterales bacterium]